MRDSERLALILGQRRRFRVSFDAVLASGVRRVGALDVMASGQLAARMIATEYATTSLGAKPRSFEVTDVTEVSHAA